MQNNHYVSLEMRLVCKKKDDFIVDEENCDIYGRSSNDNKMNLFAETIQKNFLVDRNGFYLEKVYHNGKKINSEKILWVLDGYPYTLKYVKDKFGENSSLYRSAIGYYINDGIDLFVFNTDYSFVIPVHKDLLIITKKENFNTIMDEVSSVVNQNNALRHSIARTKQIYR